MGNWVARFVPLASNDTSLTTIDWIVIGRRKSREYEFQSSTPKILLMPNVMIWLVSLNVERSGMFFTNCNFRPTCAYVSIDSSLKFGQPFFAPITDACPQTYTFG